MATGFGGLVDAVAFGALNEVLGEIRGKDGISRPHRYEVTLFPPTGTGGSTGLGSNIFTKIMGEALGDGTVRATGLKCESIEFPGRNMDTTEDSNIYGPVRSIVNGFSYGEVTANFYMSEAYLEKQFFEEWQRQAYNQQDFTLGYYDDYVGEIQIYSLDRSGARRYGVKLWECFPKTIAAQNLDATPATTPQTVDVSFTYRYWENINEDWFIAYPINTARRVIGNTVERELIRNIPKVLRKL